MLRDDEILIGLEYELSERANRESCEAIKGIADELETAGISLAHHLHFRTGGIQASIGALGPYIVPAAQIIVPTSGVVLVAWLKSPRRRIKVKVGDTVIEASSVAEVDELLARIERFKNETAKKKRKP